MSYSWMDAELREAWEVLAEDLHGSDAILPTVRPEDWVDDTGSLGTAMTWWPDGSGAGISVPRHQPLAERLVHLADQFQDNEVEALWAARRPALWPQCPDHPATHPLRADLVHGVASWICPKTSTPIAEIGHLSRSSPFEAGS